MRGKYLWIGIFPFFLTFLISLYVADFFSFEDTLDDLGRNEVKIEEFSHHHKNLYPRVTEIKNCVPADLKFIRNTLNKRKFELVKQLDNNKLSDEIKNKVVEELIKIKLDIERLNNFENTSNNSRFESQVINLLYLEKCF